MSRNREGHSLCKPHLLSHFAPKIYIATSQFSPIDTEPLWRRGGALGRGGYKLEGELADGLFLG